MISTILNFKLNLKIEKTILKKLLIALFLTTQLIKYTILEKYSLNILYIKKHLMILPYNSDDEIENTEIIHGCQ